jgi:hypothetical protein
MTKGFHSLALVLCGILLGGLMMWKFPVLAQSASGQNATMDVAGLSAEVTKLKASAPNQSHVMGDVGFMFSNVWFAAQKKNWPLANYYLGETTGRLRWMIRIEPIAKEPAGVVDLQSIYNGIESGILPGLKQAIEKKDSAQFVIAYRQVLESCYACHTTVGRPYLRPMVPTAPPQTIINYDPIATWPAAQ